jgi:hypothetical protein
MALHCAPQADPECLHRELQWQAPGRAVERDPSSARSITREVLALWKVDYNTIRPRCSLGNLPPAIYAMLHAPVMQRDGTSELCGGSPPRCITKPNRLK